jgi:hypothetical protein
VWFCWRLWITITITMFSWWMKQIFIFVAMSIPKIVATWQPRNLTILTRNPDILRLFFGVVQHLLGWLAPIFWRRGKQGNNSKFSPLQWNASHISGSRFPETWVWKPDSLFSARWGNSSHCEVCNASPQQDIPSSRDFTNIGNIEWPVRQSDLNACDFLFWV